MLFKTYNSLCDHKDTIYSYLCLHMTSQDYQLDPFTPEEIRIRQLREEAIICIQSYRGIEAIPFLQDALSIIKTNKTRWDLHFAVLRDLGRAYSQIGDIQMGLQFQIQAFEICEDSNVKASSAALIADEYLRSGNKEQALAYSRKSLDCAPTSLDLMSKPYQVMGGVAALEKDFVRAIKLLNQAAEYAEQSHCLTDLAMIIMDLSAVYTHLRKPETALSEIYRAERYVKESRNLDLYTRCAIRRASILYQLGRDDEAKKVILGLDEQKC